jgi:hypothetical protein
MVGVLLKQTIASMEDFPSAIFDPLLKKKNKSGPD